MTKRRYPQSPEERCWRVFYTRAHAEKRCEQRLLEQGIHVFLPKYSVERQWSDRRRTLLVPLFPNYIFAYVTEQERLEVLQMDGIVRCLAFGGRIARVSEEEIERIKKIQKVGHQVSRVDMRRIPPGTPVRVIRGLVQGLVGELVAYRGKRLLVVRLPAIRQALQLVVPEEWVEPLQTEAKVA